MENSVKVPQKTKHRTIIQSSNPTPEHISGQETITQKYSYTPMFITALFTIAKTGKQPKYPLTDEQIKMWYICTMDYYSAIKKNEIMPFTATWMQLVIIILSEVRSERKRQIGG